MADQVPDEGRLRDVEPLDFSSQHAQSFPVYVDAFESV